MAATRPALDPIAEARRQWIDHGWIDAADGMAVVTSIMRVQQLMLAGIDEVLKPFDVTFARYEILTLLSFSSTGAMPIGKVGARLQVHPTSVTPAVERLERQGLVRRSAHPTDGRTTLVEITEAGRELSRRATCELNDQVFERLGLSDADTGALLDLLGRYRSVAESSQRDAAQIAGRPDTLDP